MGHGVRADERFARSLTTHNLSQCRSLTQTLTLTLTCWSLILALTLTLHTARTYWPANAHGSIPNGNLGLCTHTQAAYTHTYPPTYLP